MKIFIDSCLPVVPDFRAKIKIVIVYCFTILIHYSNNSALVFGLSESRHLKIFNFF